MRRTRLAQKIREWFRPVSRSRSAGDRGQSMLEFALMAPFLLLLMTGVVELGRVIFYTVAVNHAATAGVDFAAQDATTAQNLNQTQLYATQDANFPGTTATATYGCYCDTGAGVSCTYQPGGQDCTGSNGDSCSCGTIGSKCSAAGDQIVECVQVTTKATITPLFHFPALPASYQANGHAVLRVRN